MGLAPTRCSALATVINGPGTSVAQALLSLHSLQALKTSMQGSSCIQAGGDFPAEGHARKNTS